jgi:hypothetical protein
MSEDAKLTIDDMSEYSDNIYVKAKENVVEKKLLKSEVNNKKKLYQNIGTRVSILREINESYQSKIKSQEEEIKLLDDKIQTRLNVLEKEMRDEKKLMDPEWVKKKYEEMLLRGTISSKVNRNHYLNDPELKKIDQQKQSEIAALQDKLNELKKKTEVVKEEINILRVENHKFKSNLDHLIEKKEKQTKEMDKISEEANKFLNEKDEIAQKLVDLNKKIDDEKSSYETKMLELNKMIDNTRKIKEFHETLAFEKFSKSTLRKTAFNLNTSSSNNENKPTNKIAEEENRLAEMNKELKRKKSQTVYLNLFRFIIFKKQQELNRMIEKIQKETGVEDLENLSTYLDISSTTNKLFETDLKILNEQKISLQKEIENIKIQIEKAECVLNDTTSKKIEHLKKLDSEYKQEEDMKEKLIRKIFMLNRVINLLAIGFKEACLKINFFDKNLKLEAEVDKIYNQRIPWRP